MEFRIADTFTGSLSKLTGDEQKAAKIAALFRPKLLDAGSMEAAMNRWLIYRRPRHAHDGVTMFPAVRRYGRFTTGLNIWRILS